MTAGHIAGISTAGVNPVIVDQSNLADNHQEEHTSEVRSLIHRLPLSDLLVVQSGKEICGCSISFK